MLTAITPKKIDNIITDESIAALPKKQNRKRRPKEDITTQVSGIESLTSNVLNKKARNEKSISQKTKNHKREKKGNVSVQSDDPLTTTISDDTLTTMISEDTITATISDDTLTTTISDISCCTDADNTTINCDVETNLKTQVKRRLPKSIQPDYETRILREKDVNFVIGVDEAGRGCLAGPVVVCACFIPLDKMESLDGVVDSKVLDENHREQVYSSLTLTEGFQYVTVERSAEYIDSMNILSATMDAMAHAVELLVKKLSEANTQTNAEQSSSKIIRYHVAIDGNRLPEPLKNYKSDDAHCITSEAIVSGDAKVFSIAAASITAKVTRDRLINKLAESYPIYHFEHNKGYGTQSHINALKDNGVQYFHRLTFRPICTLLISGSISWPEGRNKIEVDPVKRQLEAKKKRIVLKNQKNQLPLEKSQLTLEQMFGIAA